MGFTYEGEVSSVRDAQKDFISKVLEERGFKDCVVTISPVGQAGDNYIANVKRIIVNQNGETLRMIAKLAPDVAMLRQMASINLGFYNEHIIYTELFQKFKELQRNAGVPEEEWFKHPECFGTTCEEPNEVILLEDLKESGHNILDRFKPMTNECVKMVLKSFAVLHSLSFVLKHEEPKTFASIASKFYDIHKTPDHLLELRKQFGTQLENQTLDTFDSEEDKEAFKGCLSNMEDLAADIRERETGSKYSVIQQGDGWTNNIMFKLKDEKPLQCILIDYQMSKESNPVYDIVYMIFNSTKYDQRKSNFYDYIDYYYDELNKSLNNYGLKADEVYPRNQLNDDMRRYAKLVLGISVIVTNLITKETEEASDFKDSLNNFENVADTMVAAMKRTDKSELVYKDKMQGIVKSMLHFKLL